MSIHDPRYEIRAIKVHKSRIQEALINMSHKNNFFHSYPSDATLDGDFYTVIVKLDGSYPYISSQWYEYENPEGESKSS